MKSFKVAAVLAHHFEQCSKEKQFRPGSGQDVDGFVARPRLVTSELMKVFGGRLRMQLKKTNKKTFVNFASNIA